MVQAQPQTFWFVGNQGKISENLCKIPEYSDKNGSQHGLIFETDANVCSETHDDLSLEVKPKEFFMIFVGKNF